MVAVPEADPLMPPWLAGAGSAELDELLLAEPCGSRFGLAGSDEMLPEAEPETEPPVEALGSFGAGAEADGAGVTTVVADDVAGAPGPPEDRSTRSSPQPARATATAEAASSKRKFDFMEVSSLQLAMAQTGGSKVAALLKPLL